jgi:uncharacterized protein YlzI (FlbEa/FlbD family)
MINLTAFEEITFWINPKHIVAFERQGDWTVISMTNGQSFRVKETPEIILEKIC